MKYLLLSTLLSSLVLMTSAQALDLSSARSQGLVCEQSDGYVKAVASDADTKSLVHEVNGARKREYESIASKTGAPLPDVAATAGAKLVGGGAGC